jgi:hypothetical protein
MKYIMLYEVCRQRGLALLTCGFLMAQNLSMSGAIIPPDRLPANGSWQGIAGVPGGIPNRTNIFVNVLTTANSRYKCVADGVTDNLASIENALNDCPSNQVVYLPTGTYYVSGAINSGNNYWTLRGDGQGKTIVTGAGNGVFNIGSSPWGAGANSWNWGNTVSITGGATKGSTSITVASIGNIAVGQLMWLEQANDGTLVFGYGADNGNADDRLNDGTHCLNMRVMVTNIVGNTISFTPALLFDFNANLSPAAVGFGGTEGPRFSGLEDLTVKGSSGAIGIALTATYGFWLRDVELTGYSTFGLEIGYGCVCTEVREFYVHEPVEYYRNHGYSIQLDAANNNLIADSISWHNSGGIFVQASCGNVFAYNFLFDETNGYAASTGDYGVMEKSLYANHTPFPNMNLFEGNYSSGLQMDFYYGPARYYTIFRNYLPGTDRDVIQARICLSIDSHNWSNSVVGNILGSACTSASLYSVMANQTFVWSNTTPQTWVYDSGVNNNFPYSWNVIYRLGYPSSGNNGYGDTYPTGGTNDLNGLDLLVKSNTIIHGNWDYATRAITWSPTISDTNIPNSFYLTSKPSWWDSSPWPPYDPNNATSATLTNLPAAKRFFFGANSATNGASGNQPPVAMATATPASGLTPLAVTFSSAGSLDPEGSSLTYSWTFGDGSTSTATNPTHTYQSAGIYFAQLNVSDGVNTTASSNISINVTNAINVTLPVPQGLQITQ